MAAKTVLILGGGTGGLVAASRLRRMLDKKNRIVLVDQRGCGRSTPGGEVRANTTLHLLDDLERLRLELGAGRWLLFGGSWGSTLALAYAEQHPARVTEMILWGVTTGR